MFAETLSNEEVESLASTLEWDFPSISEKQKFVEGDVTTLDVIGREFPLLDREAELDLVIGTMKGVFNNTGIEPERNRIQYCFGGVSGSGKTRFAGEIAPHFNAKMEGKMNALFCRVNCRLLGNSKADANMAVVNSLLRESNVSNVDRISVSEKLRRTYNPLLFLLKIVGMKFKNGKKIIIIVNLDEAQSLLPELLLNVITEINRANGSEPSHVHAWTLPTGLDLHQFNDIQTQSNTKIIVKVLKPVRNLFRALEHIIDIDTRYVCCVDELNALVLSLDGIPRLLWAAIAAFSGVRERPKDKGFGEIEVNISNVKKFLAEAEKKQYGIIYQTIIGLIAEAPEFFTSLENMLKWDDFPRLLACFISGCPVKMTDQIGSNTQNSKKKSITEIVASGWAMMDASSLKIKNHFSLELPLLFFHCPSFSQDIRICHLRDTVNLMKSPQKIFTPKNAEQLDRDVLQARVMAFSAIGKTAITVNDLLGGGTIVPNVWQAVELSLGSVSIVDDTPSSHIADFLSNNGESVLSFISKDMAIFADSGIVFRASTANFSELTIPKVTTRQGNSKTYKPKFPNSFAILIQSKRLLGNQTNITEEFVRAEFVKVESLLETVPFILVIVTDSLKTVELKSHDLCKHVIVINGTQLDSYLGHMLARRRRAAAAVTQQSMMTVDVVRKIYMD